jgi:Pvc16 N-terminal domain
VIDDLDRTLAALLTAELPEALRPQVEITFMTPDSDFPPATVQPPAIDLFLYDVRENRELRTNEWRMQPDAHGAATREAPPARIDCSYLVTAWATSGANAPADEHRLLGEALRVLLRHPTLPAEHLQGALAGQQPPLVATALEPLRLQSVGEFWQALGGRPRAAFSYTVTMSVAAVAPAVTETLVRERRFRYLVDGHEAA